MYNVKQITSENIDQYLSDVAKEYNKPRGKQLKAEMVLVGGAAIIINYGFRQSSIDIDAIYYSSSAMKEAIRKVGEKYQLPNNWLNDDFRKTDSYSDKIREYSVYYKTFSHILEVRTLSAEYLVAMKLRSSRKYKTDISDIIGIVAEHNAKNKRLTMADIDKAVEQLYGGWEVFDFNARNTMLEVFEIEDYEIAYRNAVNKETQAKELLIDFSEEYPETLKESNINEILEHLEKQS